MKNFKEQLASLRLEPCDCEPSVYCPDDNVTYPPHQCNRCGKIESIEHYLQEVEYLAELDARERFEESREINKDQEMDQWLSEQQGH